MFSVIIFSSVHWYSILIYSTTTSLLYAVFALTKRQNSNLIWEEFVEQAGSEKTINKRLHNNAFLTLTYFDDMVYYFGGVMVASYLLIKAESLDFIIWKN